MNTRQKQKIEAVIFDWAGTTVDYGCFAPVNAFLETFRRREVAIRIDEAREPMGMKKIDHIRAILAMERVQKEWNWVHQRGSEEKDVEILYEGFENSLFAVLENFGKPLPFVLETVSALRDRGIKIGSTTGYTRAMMDIVEKKAAEQGYRPDCVVTSSEVPAGRPRPYMIWDNARFLEISRVQALLKVGDTLADIEEGVHAGVRSVGVIEGSSLMGLTEEEFKALSPEEAARRKEEVRQKYLRAGARYCLENMSELPALIRRIEDEAPDDSPSRE